MNKKNLSIVMNILIIICGLLGIFIAIRLKMMKDFFLYYTNLSNVFAVIGSIVYLLTINKDSRIAKILRYSSTICLILTLLVVIFILTPMLKTNLFIGNYMPLYHLICPLLSTISLLFFEDIEGKAFYAVVPSITYGVIVIILNIFKIVDGPYPFLKIHNQSFLTSIFWIILIYCINYAAALGVLKLNKIIQAK